MKLKHVIQVLALAALFTIGLAGAACTKQKSNIAIACESSATALDALTAAKIAGRISDAKLREAVVIYRSTIPYCQPVAESLNISDYGRLATAAAELTQRAGEAK